jgi:hypothetical protein
MSFKVGLKPPATRRSGSSQPSREVCSSMCQLEEQSPARCL